MVNYQITQNFRFKNVLYRDATREWGWDGMEEETSSTFFEIKKEILIFGGKKDPDCVHHSKIFLLFLTKCLSSALIPLNLPWKISGCTAASFFYEHGLSLVRDHYVIILYFSIIFQYFFCYQSMYDFILLITEGVIQSNMIVMIFPGIDETTLTGEMQDFQ